MRRITIGRILPKGRALARYRPYAVRRLKNLERAAAEQLPVASARVTSPLKEQSRESFVNRMLFMYDVRAM